MGRINVILLAEGKEMIRHFKLSHHTTRILIILGLCTFIGMSLFFKDYLKLKKKLREANKTVIEVSQKEMAKKEEEAFKNMEHLLTLANKLAEVKESLIRVTQVEEIVLTLVKGAKPKATPESEALGIGGSDSNPIDIDNLTKVTQEELMVRINTALEEMHNKLTRLEESKKEFRRYLESQKIRLESIPSIWPVSGTISSPYGRRSAPFSEHSEFHRGVDIRAPYGSPVKATGNGVVRTVSYQVDYGKYVEIDHGNGIVTKYAHLSKVLVRKGQHVQKGEKIGMVGTTGNSTGPHLHYEVQYRGVPINPAPYLSGSINLLVSNK